MNQALPMTRTILSACLCFSLALGASAARAQEEGTGAAAPPEAEPPAQAVAAPVPDADADPASGTHTLAGSFSPDPAVYTVRAGGPLRANLLRDAGDAACNAAWVAERPSVRIDYQAPSGLPLVFYADTAGTDPTLAIRDPSGRWHCNDDWNSLMPRVQFDDPVAGTYDVFVGTYLEGEEPQVALHVSEIVSNVPRN
jgi:hypothetical protein